MGSICKVFFVTIWIAAVMFKSNDILRKQTALKRKIPILIGISFVFGLHVIVVYWWYWNDDILYPLIMVPPKAIPPFWHAIFVIMEQVSAVGDLCAICQEKMDAPILLRCKHIFCEDCVSECLYFGSAGSNGSQVYSTNLLEKQQRSKLPSNANFGGVSASVIPCLVASTSLVSAAGDLCAICQEKMHAPILLRCKHIFCEDCVSE
ncbi:unnamed protein product [Camellia sinensis]